MRPERWRRISAVFDAVVEHSSSEWPRLLAEEGAALDAGERAEVERLLRAERNGSDPFDRPVARLGDLPTPVTTVPPSRLGDYRLLAPIGRGAMSVVYLATRDDDAFRQRVAVKLIRQGIDDPAAVRRFLAERQILAGLDHPNIARLYGGGQAPDGRPYLVMEHVEGEPLDVYCDRRALGVEERLALFLDVCSAVQHAHQSLLVHRDLKPGNILVTTDGTVKLLDFGIAKLLAPREGVDAGATATGPGPMTPGYASPEQVRGSSLTTASDVYSLGVLLFELLTGRSPYGSLRGAPHELARAICEDDTRPPSSEIQRRPERPDQPDPEELALRRGLRPGELARRLRGDLDLIVGRALDKDPERRYPSARQLALDIERHLGDRPIEARADHPGHRLLKFARRHRQGLVALVVAATLFTGLLGRLHHQADLLERSRTDTDRLTDVLLERLARRPAADGPAEATLPRAVLDTSVTEITGRFRDNRGEMAKTLGLLGRVYHRAGLAEDALWLFEGSLELQPEGDGAARADAQLDLGSFLLDAGELDRGAELLEHSLTLHRAQAGRAWALGENLEILARHDWSLGRIPRARALLQESVDVRLEACPYAVVTARVLSRLAELELQQLELAAAAPLQERAAAIRGDLSDGNFDRPRDLEDQALAHLAGGELAAASDLLEAAVRQRVERAGELQPELVDTRYWLGRSLAAQERWTEATEALRAALELHGRLGRGETPAEAAVLKHLGRAMARTGEPEAGEALLRRVLVLEAGWLPRHHPILAVSRRLLAETLEIRGDLQAASRLYRQAADDLAGRPEWDYGLGAEARLALAEIELRQGDELAARRDLGAALAGLRASHPPGHWRLARAEGLRPGPEVVAAR